MSSWIKHVHTIDILIYHIFKNHFNIKIRYLRIRLGTGVLYSALLTSICKPFLKHRCTQGLFQFYATSTFIILKFKWETFNITHNEARLSALYNVLTYINFCDNKLSVSIHANMHITVLQISSGTFYLFICCVTTDHLSCRLTFGKKDKTFNAMRCLFLLT
jgi:hypothetical protein